MRLLFVKEKLAWPRSSGHDVHCSQMMRALGELGHAVALATLTPTAPEAIQGLRLERCDCLADAGCAPRNGVPVEARLSRFQERFRSYWGIDPEHIRRVGRLAHAFRADAVVVVGLNVLPYLGAVDGALRVWYAADEWAWHHLSQVRLGQPATWSNARQAVVKGLYERAYASLLDRVWVVSDTDRRAMRWVAGVRGLDVIPNGVDGDHYAPRDLTEQEQSCTFWGRLDFGPNVQALEWFCGRVWPELRRRFPGARFTIYGFQPTLPVETLARQQGVQLVPDLPDLRDEVARRQVVVVPFVSGGGIKNKLLEAASMGKAVVCSRRACLGLRHEGNGLPVMQAGSADEWVKVVSDLWAEPQRRQELGRRARQWVLSAHTWKAAARSAVEGLEWSLEGRGLR
jgi:glycosyltransferase involved in cell wall biosynthesis